MHLNDVVGATRGLVAARTILPLIAVLWVGTAEAQVPSELAYEGYLTVNGSPVTETTSLTFALFTASTGGPALWTETQAGVPVVNGAFSVQLGSVSSLAAVPFDVQYWLETTYQGEALTPRFALSRQPYALTSASAQAVPWSGVTGFSGGFSDAVDNLGDSGTYCNPFLIPFMPWSVNISQLLIVSNAGSAAQEVRVSAVSEAGTVYDVGPFVIAPKTVVRLHTLLGNSLQDAGFPGTGDLALAIRTSVRSTLSGGVRTQQQVYVYAAYNSGIYRHEASVICVR